MSDHTKSGDGLMTAIKIISLLKKSGKKASEFLRPFSITPYKIKNLKKINNYILDTENVKNSLKKIQLDLKNKHNGRLLVRPSGTINSSAVKNPNLINELSSKFGSQCITVAIDAKFVNSEWVVHVAGGKIPTDKTLIDWAIETQDRGAGEILFTSMDHDGTKNGFANQMLASLSNKLSIPVIASGGAGKPEHFIDVFQKGKADAALAASVFHFGEIEIPDLKKTLQLNNINVRL